MRLGITFWTLILLGGVKAECSYNNLQGFCVTVDSQGHSKECLAVDGWLQFYPGEPWPREYEGCGDDGVVLEPFWSTSDL